jgi:hypothetical protein
MDNKDGMGGEMGGGIEKEWGWMNSGVVGRDWTRRESI